ncbi:hypothetical protein BDW71DRAFT_191812 [Aspergillus fruticulosus]
MPPFACASSRNNPPRCVSVKAGKGKPASATSSPMSYSRSGGPCGVYNRLAACFSNQPSPVVPA